MQTHLAFFYLFGSIGSLLLRYFLSQTKIMNEIQQGNFGTINSHLLNRYTLENEVLGAGSQGKVVKAYDNENSQKVAIKICENFNSGLGNAKRLYREFILGSRIRHPNVISLRNAFSPQQTFDSFSDVYLVFDLMNHNLRQFRRNARHAKLFTNSRGGSFIAFLIRQLLCAVKYLHQPNLRLIHRDIKTENILIRQRRNGTYVLKLGDLGSARQLPPGPEEAMSRYVVTRPYRAPEIILSDNYKRPVDLWSVGCVLVELIINNVLFRDKDEFHLIYSIMQLIGLNENEIQGLLPHIRQNVLQRRENFSTNRITAFLHSRAPQWMPHREPQIGINELSLLAKKLLIFNPIKRITAEEALNLPIWAPLGDRGFHEAGVAEEINIEEHENRSNEQWKQIIFNELINYQNNANDHQPL